MNILEFALMSILELLYLVSILILLVSVFVTKGNYVKRNKILLIVSSVLLAFHVFSEGIRWQVVPVYVAYLLIVVYGFLRIKNCNSINRGHKLTRLITFLFLFAWLIGSVIPIYFFPVKNLPEPSGQFRIGTRNILLIDSSRTDPFNPVIDKFRKVPIQVYYPAQINESAEKEPYFRDAYKLSTTWANLNGYNFLPFVWSHLNHVKTNSFRGAGISQKIDSFPVLIFSHGYGQFSKFNTIILEELASHGFIVLSISHEYETCVTEYPAGEIITFSKDLSFFARRRIEEKSDSSGYYLHQIHQTNDQFQQKELYNKFYANMYTWIESNNIWVDDIRFCINELKNISMQYLSDKIDIEQLGVLGYSFGGGASGTAAIIDKRIKACVNLDGFQYGHLLNDNFACPVMFIQSERKEGSNDYFVTRAQNDVYDLMIIGTRHSNFTDNAFLAEIPGKIMGILGSIDADYGVRITKEIVSTFFDIYLKNNNSQTMNNLLSKYPEIRNRTVH